MKPKFMLNKITDRFESHHNQLTETLILIETERKNNLFLFKLI